LSNQMCLSLVSMPVQMIFAAVDAIRAGWIVRLFDEKDSLRGVVLGVDLPRWVFVAVFCLTFAPWLAMSVIFALSITGPLGGHWCDSIYDTACYPGADKGTDCHEWSWPCNSVNDVSWGVGIAMASYGLFVMAIYFALLFSTSWYLKRLPYALYRVAHTEIGFQLRTRMYSTGMFALTSIVLMMVPAARSACDPHVLMLVGFLPVEMVVCYLVVTTLIVRTPYFITREVFEAMQWDRTFLWTNAAAEGHQARRPPLSVKSGLSFERALQAFYFSYVAYDHEENPSSMFTIDYAMRLHNLTNFKLIWKRSLDAKALMSWNQKTKVIVVAIRGTASGKNAVTDLKIVRSAHEPERGTYWLGTKPMIHSGFAEFWIDSGLREDVLKMVEFIMEDGGDGDGDASGRWQIWCYGHSLGGAAAKLAAMDIQRHIKTRHDASVSCYTYGCPYVGNKAFVDDFNATIECAWDLFHPNDAVSITGKWFIMYKRCSQVCLVSRFGDLVLNPSGLERLSLRPFGTKSVSEHLLATYARSLLSVIEKWTIIEEYEAVSEKQEDTLANLLDANPAVLDLVTLFESMAMDRPSGDVGGGDGDGETARPTSAGEQMILPLLRAWKALDLEALARYKRKRR